MSKICSPRPGVKLLTMGLLALGCTLITACSKKAAEEDLQLIPVSGKVFHGKTPVGLGEISFVPDKAKGNNSEKTAKGHLHADGTYTLEIGTASGVKRGAPPGWYKVCYRSTGPTEGDQANLKKEKISQEYADPKKTPLSIEVKEGANYDITLN